MSSTVWTICGKVSSVIAPVYQVTRTERLREWLTRILGPGPGRFPMSLATERGFRTDVFVAGRFRESVSGERFVTENPATGQPLAQVAAGGAPDIDLAVRSAREAFDDGRWSAALAGRAQVGAPRLR